VYPWKNSNPAVDELCEELQGVIADSEKRKLSRPATFIRMWKAVNEAADRTFEDRTVPLIAVRAAVPYLNEPWYC
jgi:hypothetical protein